MYILGGKNSSFFFIDVNECDENNGGCDQICTNTDESFVFSCNEGFLLDRHAMVKTLTLLLQ